MPALPEFEVWVPDAIRPADGSLLPLLKVFTAAGVAPQAVAAEAVLRLNAYPGLLNVCRWFAALDLGVNFLPVQPAQVSSVEWQQFGFVLRKLDEALKGTADRPAPGPADVMAPIADKVRQLCEAEGMTPAEAFGLMLLAWPTVRTAIVARHRMPRETMPAGEANECDDGGPR